MKINTLPRKSFIINPFGHENFWHKELMLWIFFLNALSKNCLAQKNGTRIETQIIISLETEIQNMINLEDVGNCNFIIDYTYAEKNMRNVIHKGCVVIHRKERIINFVLNINYYDVLLCFPSFILITLLYWDINAWLSINRPNPKTLSTIMINSLAW